MDPVIPINLDDELQQLTEQELSCAGGGEESPAW